MTLARRLGALAPDRFPYRRFGLALVLGAAGGLAFATLRLPLPWMLGAMVACTVAALLGVPIAAPQIVRRPMSAIVGVMLGSGFSPAVLAAVPGWLPTLAGLAAFLLTAGAACIAYFRRVGGFDRRTAFFAGMPGGLVEMTAMAEARGADVRLVALAHSARILLLVLSLPLLMQYAGGLDIANRARMGQSVAGAPWTTDALLVAAALVGALAGRRLRLPAPFLTGPMAVSAGLHATGATDFVPPFEIVNLAQLVLGAAIGCGFAGTAPRLVLRVIALSVGSTLILLASTALFAWLVAALTGQATLALVLAYSPGGLTEMSLIALTLHLEVAFVAFHHIARMLMVILGASAFLRNESAP